MFLRSRINSLHFPERAPVVIKHRPIAFIDENGGGPGRAATEAAPKEKLGFAAVADLGSLARVQNKANFVQGRAARANPNFAASNARHFASELFGERRLSGR